MSIIKKLLVSVLSVTIIYALVIGILRLLGVSHDKTEHLFVLYIIGLAYVVIHDIIGSLKKSID